MLYAFGSNGRGQLSIGHDEDVHIPTLCSLSFPSQNLGPPKTIAAGGNHTIVLFPSGEAFSVGDNTFSQCCIPATTTSSPMFQPIPPPSYNEKWKLASAGWNFTILASSDNRVFVSGNGTKGELGLGATIDTAISQLIPDFPPEGTTIEGISSCMSHTLAVLSNGHVYGWGAGRKGQLGTPALPSVSTPRRIHEVPWPVEKAVCGRESSALMSRPEKNDGVTIRRLIFLGNDKYRIRDALGTPIEGIEDIQASWSSVYIHYSDGRLIGFGRNDRGQLPPPGLMSIQRFAAGSEHVVAITEGKLVAWGWGEHGNCGKSREEDGGGDVVGVVEDIKIPESNGEIISVGAGCATSWAWVAESKKSID